MERTYSIYSLNEPNSEIVRYVGFSYNPNKRYEEHLRENHICYKRNWVKSLKNENQLPLLYIIEDGLTKDEALQKEIHYIKLFKSAGARLTNSTIGGEAPMANKKHTEETKAKMSEDRKGEKNAFYGKKMSKELKEKLSLCHKGKPSWSKGKRFTEEHKLKLSLAKKDKHPSNYGKTRFDLENIRVRYANGEKQLSIAKSYNTDSGTISKIVNKINYK
jgi:group I intron endonuclease